MLLVLAAPAYGQSLGDIARQERARKQAEAQQPTHVYDNDDLARPQILLPNADGSAQTVAQKPGPPSAAPAAPSAPSEADINLDPNVDQNTLPLGDIARHYRALKAARQRQQQAAQAAANQPSPAVPLPADAIANQVPARPGAPSQPPSPSAPTEADVYLDPTVDQNTLPLGDIARHYRALKAAREQQESQAAASGPMPAAEPLAYPTFTQPHPQQIAPPATDRFGTQNPTPHHADNLAGAATIAAPTTIRVHRGDTLWNLARKYLGRGKDWILLAEQNPRAKDPARLQVGLVLRLPPARWNPDPQPVQRVRVERGESLWKLSELHLGSGRAWTCIAQANPQRQSANLIFAGQMLAIPDTCASTALPPVRGPSLSAQSAPLRSRKKGT